MARFVDAVFIDDDRADKTAELDQRMPVAAVARQAGGLDREDRSGAALADRRQKTLEARPVEPERPRSSSMTTTSCQPNCRARSSRPY